MAKYRPIPRTLSDAVLKVVTGPLDPSHLVSPDQLMGQVPLLEPKILFDQTQPQPSDPPAASPPPADLKSPEQLFGRSSLTAPSSLKNRSPKKKN